MAERPKRLYRSRNDRMVAGVLGGWSDYLGLDPSLVRLTFAVLLILTGVFPGVLLYLLMAVIVPAEPGAEG